MNDKTIIQFFGIRKSYSFQKRHFIDLIKKNLLENSKVAYSHAKVNVRSDDQNTISSLIITLLHTDTYTSEVVKVVLNKENKTIDKIIRNYIEHHDDGEDELYNILGLTQDVQVNKKVLFSTPCDHIPSAVNTVKGLASLARDYGYDVVELIGPNANVNTYKTLLKAGYSGFTNIGHGSTSSISLYDGNLNYSWFNQQSFNSKTVIYLNSCQVFNNPLLASIENAKPRTFIGGVKSLPIGQSEKCCSEFWKEIMPPASSKQMKQVLEAAEQKFIPNTMGFWGYSGSFGGSLSDNREQVQQHEEALV
jgi:hypothetical protein